MTAATGITATRIRKGGKTFVRVSFPPGLHVLGAPLDLGGKRAERAAAAIVGQWKPESEARVIGLRADLGKAEQEAAALLRNEIWVRGSRTPVPTTPYQWAIAVPVDEEPSS